MMNIDFVGSHKFKITFPNENGMPYALILCPKLAFNQIEK